MADKGISVISHNGEDYNINDPNIAGEFYAAANYAVGDHVTHEGKLYVFTAAHTGAWTGTDVTQVQIGAELHDYGAHAMVRYDVAQALTDAQKTVARNNIGAANAELEDKIGTVPSGTTVENQIFSQGTQISTNASNIDALQRQVGTVPTGETVEGQITDLKSASTTDSKTYNTEIKNISGVEHIPSDNWEIGGISWSNDSPSFGVMNKRARTKQAMTDLALHEGDIIGLSDYTNNKYMYFGKKSDQTWYRAGSAYLSEDTVIAEEFTNVYIVVIKSGTEVDISEPYTYGSLFKIIRADSKNNYVHTSAQSLTSSQKTQVRTNIGAIDQDTLDDALENPLIDIENNADDIDAVEGAVQINKTVSKNGNYVVFDETTIGEIGITLTDAQNSTEVTACGRNIYKLERNAYSKNGVVFTYNKGNGSIHIVSENGVTANTFSTSDELTINGTSYSANAKYVFSEKTAITFSLNCDEFLPYDSLLFMSVITPDGVFAVRDGGFTVIVESGDEVGFRIQCRQGWQGDVTIRPQVEIGNHATAFQNFNGSTSPNLAGNANVFQLNPSYNKKVLNGITAEFDHDKQEVILSGTATADTIVQTDVGQVGGEDWNHLFKYTFDANTIVYVSGIPQKYRGNVFAQIRYNGSTYEESGDGYKIVGTSGTELGYRILVRNGTTLNRYIVKPIIATGLHALRSQNGITTVYTNDGTKVTATVQSYTNLQMFKRANEVIKNINILTAHNILTPLSRILASKPIISFIDDDTSSKSDVERYAAVFDGKGVVGNYAVMPYNIENRPTENLDTVLLNLEKRGFGMLYHCYHQNGSNPDSPGAFYLEAYRNMLLAEDDFMTGLRKFLQYGFTNGRFWVAPYGVNDIQMQNMAKRHGMRCLISMSNDRYISPYTGYNKWNVPRISVSSTSNVDHYQNTIDACVRDGGWLVVCTHANSWGSGTTMDTKVGNAIQYALDAGMEVKAFPEAFEEYASVFDLYDLM